MSDRPKPSDMAELVRDAVRSSHLDEDARAVAGLVSTEFRERVRQGRKAADAAAPIASDASARGAAAARTAAGSAYAAAGPALDGLYSVWWEVSKLANRLVRGAQRQAGPAARQVARQAEPIARQAQRQAEPLASRVAPAIVPVVARVAPTARRAAASASSTARSVADEAVPVAQRAGRSAAEGAQSFAESPAGQAVAVGAAAGAVGAIVMGVALVTAERLGIIGRVPPHEITARAGRKSAKKARRASRKAASDAPAKSGSEQAASEAAEASSEASDAPSSAFVVPSALLHVAFGSALGAGFAAAYVQLPEEWRAPLPTVGESLAFATGVWAVSYAGWLPALGLMPPPHRDEPSRPLTMVAAHWIFGACLGAGLVAGLSNRD